MSLPFSEVFTNESSINSFWNGNSGVALTTISSSKYVGKSGPTAGNFGVNLYDYKGTYSPGNQYQPYSFRIKLGPYGMGDIRTTGSTERIFEISVNEYGTTNLTNIIIEANSDGIGIGTDFIPPISYIDVYPDVNYTFIVTVASNYPTDTTTITWSLYDDLDGLVGSSNITVDGGDSWNSATPLFKLGPNFYISEASIYLEGSCIAKTSLIETIHGLKPVEYLTETDQLIDSNFRPSNIVKVWKSKIPMVKPCVRLDDVIVSDKHCFREEDTWCSARDLELETFPLFTDFYQIQTDSYGFRTGKYTFSTWTEDYVNTHQILDMV